MNRIRLLPEQVANQIAAGEVVERPASIVKELVENALDAQATRITVEIQAGGRSLVRVTDDGVGMSKDDALMCLERHATSKIQRAEDLATILTMGFRGEALPSIASVSRFQLTTRERDNGAPEGTQVVINGGKIIEVKAAGSAPGTSVEVRQVFFNLPARRKFLRSEETERAHIQHYLTLAALAHPDVAFNFVHDGKTVWQLPAAKRAADTPGRLAALQERLRAVHGAELSLLPVNHHARLEPRIEEEVDGTLHDAPNNLHLWGFIGSPGVSRSTRDDQNVFVNRRPVENRGLNYALIEGYHTALMKGRYPVCCLFLEIDPSEVDVNIHPAKREVKFHREREVRQFVTNAVRNALLKFHTAPPAPALDLASKTRTQSNATTTVAMSAPAPVPAPLAPTPAPPPPPEDLPELPMLLPPQTAAPISQWPDRPLPAPAAFMPDSTSELETPTRFFTPPPLPAPVPAAAPFVPKPGAAAVPLLAVPLRLVGVVGRLYVVLESDRGMVLMDQHAAHERVLYEQMLARMEQGNAASQRLLLPETVEVSIRDAHFLRSQLSALVRLGVGLSDFGERTFLLDALPPFVKVSDARRFVLELVDELKAAGDGVNSMRLGENVVAKTVCRHAIKANDPLNGPELENLVNDLRHCAMPYTCPHGRPTLIEMNFRELEKKFGRSQ